MQKITPSKHDPFLGALPNSITERQQRKAAAMSKKIEGNRRRMRLPATYDVVRWTEPTYLMEIPKRLVFPCPVIACTPDRARILVIAPDGSDYWTDWK
ncbi:MAG: hypothetical protein K2X76_05060 [Sphingomonas sp.]|nr:hypothetical protein [Sphingomonas sp.]